MATLYCDFDNGNDNYGGTSFAVLQQGTNGRITSTTFSSAGASFPNDDSLIGQYLSIFNGTSYLTFNITAWVSATSLTIAQISGGDALANQAVDRQFYIGGRWKSLTTGATAARLQPGDTVRVMGSPAPTSLGINGTWTSGAQQATKNITGATNATPISITCTAHGYSTGDTVVITSVGGNTHANGTWEITSTGTNTFTLDGSTGNATYTSGGTARLRNNTRVKLASAVTQNIASTGPGRAAWTSADANISITTGNNTKEHALCDIVSVLTAFTTGKAAYYVLPATLDLSNYQQVSFWLYSTVALSSSQIELRLCSDAAGATAVNTISVPAVPAANRYQAVTVNLGSNLGSSIASLALYVNTDLSTTANQNLNFSNIIACKASSAADSLTLTSLIGKNTTGETFWGIQSINGTRVMLDADTNATPTSTSVRGYYGTSETVTTWKRETIKLGPAASSSTALQTIQDSGTDGSPITFSGGWDRTNMSTQNLETWLDGVNGQGILINYNASTSYTQLNKIAVIRSSQGVYHGTSSSAARVANFNLVAANNNTIGISISPIASAGVIIHAVANSSDGVVIGNPPKSFVASYILSNGGNGLHASGGARFTATAKNNGLSGFYQNAPFMILANCESAFNGYSTTVAATSAYAINTIADVLPNLLQLANSMFSQNHDNVNGNHKIFLFGALISAATDQRHTASGISWKIQPTSTIRDSSWPVTLSLAKVACAANSLVTVKAWMRRDNAGLTMRLLCKGEQIAGVSADVVSAMTAAANTWAEQTITFTPTETGVVEITAEAWGGTTYSGWVDDLTITQA